MILPARHHAPLGPDRRRAAAHLRHRGQQPHRPAQAVPVEVRAAARARAVLRARPARARPSRCSPRAPTSRSTSSTAAPGPAGWPAPSTSSRSTRSTSSAGTAASTPTPSTSPTTSRSPAGSTSRRRCTRSSRAHNFVICNFVPRKVDYHPLAVPVPYYHSNVDSDEIMFYVDGDYEARKGSGIGKGSISVHPGGHSPRPAARRGRAVARRRVLRRARRHGRHLPPAGPRRGRHRGRRREVRLDVVGTGAVRMTAPLRRAVRRRGPVPARRRRRWPPPCPRTGSCAPPGRAGRPVRRAGRPGSDELRAHLGDEARFGVSLIADGRRSAGRRRAGSSARPAAAPRRGRGAGRAPTRRPRQQAVRGARRRAARRRCRRGRAARAAAARRGARRARRHPAPRQVAHRRRAGRAVPAAGSWPRPWRPASRAASRSSARPGCTTPSGTPTRPPASRTTASSTCCSPSTRSPRARGRGRAPAGGRRRRSRRPCATWSADRGARARARVHLLRHLQRARAGRRPRRPRPAAHPGSDRRDDAGSTCPTGHRLRPGQPALRGVLHARRRPRRIGVAIGDHVLDLAAVTGDDGPRDRLAQRLPGPRAGRPGRPCGRG